MSLRNHSPEQASVLLAFHQPAAHQVRSNNFCGAAEEGMGQGWEILGVGSSDYLSSIIAKPMPTLGKKLLAPMLVNSLRFALIAGTLASATSCTASETVSKINCEAYGDAVVASNTGDLILEQRLIKYQELEEYGRNMTGKRGGQRAICTVKNNPPGYKWVSCRKDEKGYTSYSVGSSQKLFEVQEAIANSVQYRGWSGACKVKL